MSYSLKSSVEKLIDLIKLEILKIKLIIPEIAEIIASYKIEIFKIVKYPNRDELDRNLICLKDCKVEQMRVNDFIFNVQSYAHIKKEEIGLNLHHRQNLNSEVGDMIPIIPWISEVQNI